MTVRTAQRTATVPVRARLVRIGTGKSWSQLDGGSGFACALTTAGEPHCFGYAFNAQTGFASDVWEPTRLQGDNRFRAIYAGGTHSCGLDAVDSTAWCWGPSRHGQLGNVEWLWPELRYVPYQEVSRRPWAWLTVGGHGGTCGLDASDSLLYCWGHNDYAQLGLPLRAHPPGFWQAEDITGPTRSFLGMEALDASVGDIHGCMLTTEGETYCGSRANQANSGQDWLGKDPADTGPLPWRVVGGHRFKAIGTGFASTCGLREDGRVLCWGISGLGALGAGELPGAVRGMPAPVAVDVVFDRLRTGDYGGCARSVAG